ncbi:MAG: radical SAM protein [Candidatus Paceibacterota bacterium]|jgi:radical SAM superfamily enzyme YgiQ (UPF0313 family)
MKNSPLIYGLQRPNDKPDLILVNSPIRDYTDEERQETEQLPAIGLGYIATVCEKAGFNVGLLDVEVNGLSPEKAAEIINESNPRWVGVNMLTPTFPLAKRIIANINKGIQIEVGAAHSKALSEKILRDSEIGHKIDLIVLEDGELISKGLLEGKNPSEMGGVAYIDKSSGQYIEHRGDPEGKWIPKDLDALPYLNRKFFKNGIIKSEGRLEANIVGSRGCPFSCPFCAGAKEMLIFGIRQRSIENIVQEIKNLKEQGVTAIRFIDDLFLSSPARIKQFFKLMTEAGLNEHVVWDATGRANILSKLDKETLELMARSGAREISIGVESGSQRMLDLMNKGIKPEMVRSAIVNLASVGIRTKTYFMLGIPSETEEEAKESVAFMHELRNLARKTVAENPLTPTGKQNEAQSRGSMFIFRPYPGTPFSEQLQGKKEWPEGTWKNSEQPLFTEEEILESFHPTTIKPGLEVRQKHSFSTTLQLGPLEPSKIQEMVDGAMLAQKEDMVIHGEYLPGIKEIKAENNGINKTGMPWRIA